MTPEQQSRLQALPQVQAMLELPEIRRIADSFPREMVLREIRSELDSRRHAILSGDGAPTFDTREFVAAVENRVHAQSAPSMRGVINATGIIVHTNLGRAPLAAEALDAIRATALGYANVEYDLDSGARGSRMAHVENLLTELTGAEAALVVNNNAAAVLLALNTFAQDGGVVVSRGELVEIGGSFRIPEVVKRGMARLVEVGTTNKTRIRDYADAIDSNTRALLKVHPSNYRILGFTESVSREELVALGSESGVTVIEDLGSGALIDFSEYGLPRETTLREAIAAGVDVVTASGDKLLGGPQAGIIAGQKTAVEAMRKNPILRALRVDKLCLAALEATLRIYRDPKKLPGGIPVLRMIAAPAESIRARALVVQQKLSAAYTSSIEDGFSYAGGGALPGEGIPTALLCLRHATLSPDQLIARLRAAATPIVARIHDGRVVLDLRTVSEDGDALIVKALAEIA